MTSERVSGVSRRFCLWCERGESNPHGLSHWILSPARLPVPPLSHADHTMRCTAPLAQAQHPLQMVPPGGVTVREDSATLGWRPPGPKARARSRTQNNTGPRAQDRPTLGAVLRPLGASRAAWLALDRAPRGGDSPTKRSARDQAPPEGARRPLGVPPSEQPAVRWMPEEG